MTNSSRSISGSTRVVGVCGQGIAYTLSPAMHNAAFQECNLDFVYVTFEVPFGSSEQAVNGIRALGLGGANVTKPLKTDILPFLDVVTEQARQIGSVNTVVNRNGILTGSSTDGGGLQRALAQIDVTPEELSVVILGAGGAARAACAMCRSSGAKRLTVAARNNERARETATVGSAETVSMNPESLGPVVRDADLVINTVPADLPWDPAWFSEGQTVYDTRYDKADTMLMQAARKGGSLAANGIDMLLYQGALSFELWTGQEAPLETMRKALEEGLRNR